MSQNLFFALAAEHKQRTGHDIFRQFSMTYMSCDVCLYLDAEKRRMEESEHFRELEAGQRASK
jgi:hypothetical protein